MDIEVTMMPVTVRSFGSGINPNGRHLNFSDRVNMYSNFIVQIYFKNQFCCSKLVKTITKFYTVSIKILRASLSYWLATEVHEPSLPVMATDPLQPKRRQE
uniref:SFRICE_008789 n=1 Tax=Spodoptera frugiperda TaxID=7108 RepID=A0A2H1VNP3_SPOFR